VSGVATVRVPRLLALTDRSAIPVADRLVDQVVAAVAGGAEGIVVRERDLPGPQRWLLGERLRAAIAGSGLEAALVWAAPRPTDVPPGDGLHRRADDPAAASSRPGLLGRSCHGVEDLLRAADEGCDYVTVSPVAATPSKPGYGPPLGADGLRTLLERAAYGTAWAPRVIALGGVTPDNARSFIEAGAHGVAVMGGLMRAADPGSLACALRDEVTA
jgi:thiamine-phosphate pyrophosphorylase